MFVPRVDKHVRVAVGAKSQKCSDRKPHRCKFAEILCRAGRCNRHENEIRETRVGLDHLSYFVISCRDSGVGRGLRYWLAGLIRGVVFVVWEDDDFDLPWHISALKFWPMEASLSRRAC